MSILSGYGKSMRAAGKSPATIEKYIRECGSFLSWLGDQEISGEAAASYRGYLISSGRAAATVNAAISALNGLLAYLNLDARLKFLRVQKRAFRDASRDLDRSEYLRMVRAARERGDGTAALVLETICATGIRVSELKYITVEAAARGRTDVNLKGKVRTILLPSKLCRKLEKYARRRGIRSGEIFISKSGGSLSRLAVWRLVKRCAAMAGVDVSKAFPHNLRHLFAKCFYNMTKDAAKLADVLGHSSIDTTRIYIMTTDSEHRRCLDSLGLAS